MPPPPTFPKALSIIVQPVLMEKFNRRCRSQKLVGQRVLRALVELYLEGHLELAPNKRLPRKPYRCWLAFKSDTLMYERVLRKSRELGIPAGAIVRRLAQRFADRDLEEKHDAFVRDSAAFIPGVGGRGWKGRAPRPPEKPRRVPVHF